jgi:hypothetical protein
MSTRPSRALQAEWNRKLAESGFKDIEYRDRSEFGVLKSNPIVRPTQAEDEFYWVLVGRFLHRHTFESERDRLVWEWHAQGATCRAIAAAIGSSRCTVNRTIQRLTEIMLALPLDEL